MFTALCLRPNFLCMNGLNNRTPVSQEDVAGLKILDDDAIIIKVASERINQASCDKPAACGIGMVMKQGNGQLVMAKAATYESAQLFFKAKLLAIRIGLIEAVHRDFKKIEIQVDEKTMVAWLQRKTPTVSDVSVIV